MSSLFRTAAIRSHRQRLLGDVVLVQPRFMAITSLFLGIAATFVVFFLATGTYARKETVTGVLSPRQGIVKIVTPATGVIDRLLASEGLPVDEGDVLVSIRDERLSSTGLWIDREMESAIDVQLDEIRHRRILEDGRLANEQKRLFEQISGLEAERSAVARQLETQRTLLAKSQSNLRRVREVAAEGYVSQEDLAAKEKSFLSDQQLGSRLQQADVVIRSRINQLRLEMDQLPNQNAERMSQLSAIEADLRLKKLELEHRGSFTVTAPVAGTVTAVQATIGGFADPRIPLLTILPAGSKLEAHLYVPTRAIGFVEVGQEVRLLYDAFDYRRFGSYTGRVAEISASVLSPIETSLTMRTAEPTYRVTVDIPVQTVAAYGRFFSLQAGMLLRADIVLEDRSLLDWIFEPLLSLKGRT